MRDDALVPERLRGQTRNKLTAHFYSSACKFHILLAIGRQSCSVAVDPSGALPDTPCGHCLDQPDPPEAECATVARQDRPSHVTELPSTAYTIIDEQLES